MLQERIEKYESGEGESLGKRLKRCFFLILTKEKMGSNLSLSVSSSALKDIDSITAWYQKISRELAMRFVKGIENSLIKVTNSPKAF